MYGHQRGKQAMGWADELGDWDWHVCTVAAMYKLDN